MAGDPYRYFRIEARELLDQLGKGALDLEKSAAPGEIVAHLLRLAHTLKGAARVVKQREIADLAHAVEGALAPLRDGAAPLPAGRVNDLLQQIDAMAARVQGLGAPAESAAPVQAELVSEELFRTARADIGEMDAVGDGVAGAQGQVATLRRRLEAMDRVEQQARLLAELLRGSTHARARATSEGLLELVSGLARELGLGLEQLDRDLRQVRQSAERLRLLPAGLLFTALERAARDAAQSLGRRVAFETQGGGVLVDSDVLREVQAALVQLVRNAVAHGIEPEAERAAAGKPVLGQICLEVGRRGSRVSFVCRDDGRGVDLEAVQRIAGRRGGPHVDAAALDSEELLRILLEGGISTSGTVTEIAGRGIGLDVVRDVVSRLGGDVNAHTEPGRGMRVELLVPVSLSSLDALQVEAGPHSVAIPLDSVRRTLRVASADLAHTPEGEAIVFEGNLIRFAPLARALRADRPLAAPPEKQSVVVVAGDGALAAIAIDRMLGVESLVIKPLPERTPADAVVAGICIDAEGDPRIVLDPDALVAELRRPGRMPEAKPVARLPILVIDDSLTTRMLEQSILESAGYEVDVAVCAEEGLEKARQRSYALFLVDVEMPGMDGFSFVERTRAERSLRHVPAILITSRAAPEDRRRGEEAGASAYIVKSEFDQTELLRCIERLVA